MSRLIGELGVPEGMTLDHVKERLGGDYTLKEESERRLERTFLETFDWRMHDAKAIIEHALDAQRGELLWRQRKSGKVLHRIGLSKTPGFVRDLPDGAFRKQLDGVLAMRALLPIVRVESTRQTLRVLGAEEKTVVRLELERGRFVSPDGEQSGDLGTRIHLLPVRGYDAEFDQVSRRLLANLKPAEASLFDAALQAIGRTPGDYSSKLNFSLTANERADQAAKDIHLSLLRTLEANIDGSRANTDSEFLHDLRVATRRTRSALTQIKLVFPSEVVERFKNGFAWIGQVTGPVRDMDVYLLALDDYKSELPPMLREHLEPLRDFLEAHHASEQKILSRKLASPHFRKILKEWRTFLEAPVPNKPLPANAGRRVKQVADERIWKMYRRVLKEGRAITDQSPPEDLHELRKSCKKLRYLMEFFQSLYAPDQTHSLIKVIKVLLDNLGSFQDLEVQANTLHDFAEQMVEEKIAGHETLLAMGALIGGLSARQQEAWEHFGKIFSGFDTAEHRLQFKTLFKEEASQEAST
jgi:CHAD domain-containing protein